MDDVNGRRLDFMLCVLVVRFQRLFYSTHGSVSPLKMSLRWCTLPTAACHTKCEVCSLDRQKPMVHYGLAKGGGHMFIQVLAFERGSGTLICTYNRRSDLHAMPFSWISGRFGLSKQLGKPVDSNPVTKVHKLWLGGSRWLRHTGGILHRIPPKRGLRRARCAGGLCGKWAAGRKAREVRIVRRTAEERRCFAHP